MNIVLSIAIAWLICQIIKMLTSGKLSAFNSVGGMPSAHSTLVGALAMAAALYAGASSVPATISYVLLFIVAHDAVKVRKHHTWTQVFAGIIVGALTVLLLSYF